MRHSTTWGLVALGTENSYPWHGFWVSFGCFFLREAKCSCGLFNLQRDPHGAQSLHILGCILDITTDFSHKRSIITLSERSHALSIPFVVCINDIKSNVSRHWQLLLRENWKKIKRKTAAYGHFILSSGTKIVFFISQ